MVRSMRRWLLVLVPVVALTGGAVAIASRAHDEPPTVELAAAPTAVTTPQLIVIDVVGAVAHPGVVRLPARGARRRRARCRRRHDR